MYIYCAEDPDSDHDCPQPPFKLPEAPAFTGNHAASRWPVFTAVMIVRSLHCQLSLMQHHQNSRQSDSLETNDMESSGSTRPVPMLTSSPRPSCEPSAHDPPVISPMSASTSYLASDVTPSTSSGHTASAAPVSKPGSIKEQQDQIMKAIERIEDVQSRILLSLDNTSRSSADEIDLGSKSLPTDSEEDMEELSQLVENKAKRRQLV